MTRMGDPKVAGYSEIALKRLAMSVEDQYDHGAHMELLMEHVSDLRQLARDVKSKLGKYLHLDPGWLEIMNRSGEILDER